MQYEENVSPGPNVPLSSGLPMHMDDNELDRLFASCLPKLARTARQMLRNSEDSEDVLQEGLLSALQNLHQFQGRSKFSTWLHSIIRNEAKMHFRKLGSHQFCSTNQESSEQPGLFLENAYDPKPDAEETCAENERSRILRTTLTELPPRYRSVLQLCDIEGLGGKDAAATLGMTMSSLKTCLHRARRLVSSKIQKRHLPRGNYPRGRDQTDLLQTRPLELEPNERGMAIAGIVIPRDLGCTLLSGRRWTLQEYVMITKREEADPLVRIAWSLAGALLCAVFLTRPIDARGSNPQADFGIRSVRSSVFPHTDVPREEDEGKAVLSIPPGTILPVRLNSSLSSVKSKHGQAIMGRIMQDIPLPAGAKIREGSKVIGHIVAVIPATQVANARISFQFDKLVSSHQATPITTNLRAIAGFMEVVAAQTPQSGPVEGDVWNWRTTTQIGGDVVYGVGGPVTTAENAEGVVGSGVDSGVLSRVSAKEGTKCRGVIYGNENPQALWVFSSDACGTYGLEHLKILRAGRRNPVGLIVLSSDTGRVAIPSGTGMLLRVDEVGK